MRTNSPHPLPHSAHPTPNSSHTQSAWNYERSLYYADSCPTSHWDPLYYLHSIWHFNSALSHLFMMIFLREASTKYARVVNGGGSYGVVAQSEV